METLKLHNILSKCQTIDDLFNNADISIEQDFKSIVEHIDIFYPKLLQPLIQKLISQNKLYVISQNINLFNIRRCAKILNLFPEEPDENFQKLILDNFNKILDETSGIGGNNIIELLENSIIKENIYRNMGRTILLMDSCCREKFLDYLSKTDDGIQSIEENMESFFISDTKIDLNKILSKIMNIKDISSNKINNVLFDNIEQILNSSTYKIGFEELLSKIQIILAESDLPKDKIVNTKQQIEKYLVENFNDIITERENFQHKSYNIDRLKIILRFNTDRNLIINKFIEEYPNLQKHVYGMDVIKLENLTKGLKQIDSIKSPDILIEKMYGNTKDENTKFILSRLFTELLNKQNVSIADIYICGAGEYSSSIKIGDYIIKIGVSRKTNEYANSSRIIQPLIRKELPFDYSNPQKYTHIPSKYKTFIEVQNAVDMEWYNGLTKEEIEQELYKIYAELRDDGVIWKDIKEENVGRLLKPNITNYDISGRPLKVDDKAIGATTKSKNKAILQKGDLVVIDTDFLYTEEQIKIQETSSTIPSLYNKFEKIYQQQKATQDIIKTLKKIDEEVTSEER